MYPGTYAALTPDKPAVVQLKAGVAPSGELAAELIEYVRDRIAHFKAPRSADFTDALPRTATGKLVKGELERKSRSAGTRETRAR